MRSGSVQVDEPRQQERRRRQIVRTANSQYYLHGRLCVAVRDNDSGALCYDHAAVGSELLGRLEQDVHGAWIWRPNSQATIGTRLYFSSQIVTSTILSAARPKPLARPLRLAKRHS